MSSKQEQNQRNIMDKEGKQRIKIDGARLLHDVFLSPQNAIAMKFLRRVEPQGVSFFSSYIRASIPIHIGLNPPFFASDVT